MTHAIEGIHCAAATPVSPDGRADLALYADHCRWLLDQGCHGLALLGTTGEANSFSLSERIALVEAAARAVPAETLLPGTSTPAIGDAVTLTRHAVETGAKGVVMLPPYYYKGVSQEGLYRFYARVIEGVGDDRLRVVLYHIPQVSQIPIPHDLIARLMQDFPGIVVGIKDSSGDLENMRAMVARFPGLGVLAGADPLMLPLMQMGGAGCITATSNLRADALRVVWDGWDDPAKAAEVASAQAQIDAWRDLSNAYALLPTVKAMLAHATGNPIWANLVPPLVALSEVEAGTIREAMDRLGA